MALSVEQERILKIKADKLLKAEQEKAIQENYQVQISAKQVEIGVLEKAREAEITALEKEVIGIEK